MLVIILYVVKLKGEPKKIVINILYKNVLYLTHNNPKTTVLTPGRRKNSSNKTKITQPHDGVTGWLIWQGVGLKIR